MGREDAMALSPREIRFLLDAMTIVEDHMADREMNVTMLSRLLGLSRVTLHRKLKVTTSLSASEFIRSVRLDKAAQLIRDGGYDIRRAAKTVGFYNQSYFSKCFRAQFGCRPSEYHCINSGFHSLDGEPNRFKTPD